MDAIERAIKRNLHISKNEKVNQQTWEEFDEVKKKKHIFVFGTGVCAGLYWTRYKDNLEIVGVIDNDNKKQGFSVGDVVAEAYQTNIENMQIESVDALNRYDKDEIAVLITSTNYYEDILEQLEGLGIKYKYVLLIMEANYRKRLPDLAKKIEVTDQYGEYAKKYCEEKIQENKIVFKAFGTFSDHGKYITEQLLKRNAELDIVWIVNDLKKEVPKGVRLVWSGNWKRYIYEMETAHIWIINTVIQDYIIKRQGQVYIHTKHWASITLKRFYLDASTITDVSSDVELWKYNSKCIDYIMTGSNFDTTSCRRGFDFHKEVVELGSPRTDALFRQEEMRSKVFRHFGLDVEKKMLIYAPTYRYKKDNLLKHEAESREIRLEYQIIKQAMEKNMGGEWYIMLRLHPAVAKESAVATKENFVIDASDYEDSEELVAACDVLISDYSSIMFEPAFVKKPVFLFATDRADYIDKEYDLLIDYDTLPFPIAESNEELVRNIEKFDQAEYEEKVESFLEKYGVHEDGHASERAAEFVLKLINA